ncbi:hypothetical protein DSECCO2_640250 [anaerobic digester metagenome]
MVHQGHVGDGGFCQEALVVEREGHVHAAFVRLAGHEHVGQVVGVLDARKVPLLGGDGTAEGGQPLVEPRLGLGGEMVGGHVQAGFRAFGGVDAEAAGAAPHQHADGAVGLAARLGHLDDDLAQALPRARWGKIQPGGGTAHAPKVRVQLVDAAVQVLHALEDAVAPMGKVVVEGHEHQARVAAYGAHAVLVESDDARFAGAFAGQQAGDVGVGIKHGDHGVTTPYGGG